MKEPIATIENATTTYLHADHLGSISATTNAAGALSQSSDYYPYGNYRINNGPTQEQRQYAGTERDLVAGLDYMEARYYRSSQGQFVSQDPVFWEIGQTSDGIAALSNPQLQNSYGYAGNNPITLSDPDGRFVPALILGALTFYGGYSAGTDLYEGYTSGNRGQFAWGVVGVGTSLVPGGSGAKGAAALTDDVAKYSVYLGRDADEVVRYVGITSRNVAKRAKEHLGAVGTGKEDLIYTGVKGAFSLSRSTARSIEQAGISIGGMAKNGGQLINKVNSVATSKISRVISQSDLNRLSKAVTQLQKAINKFKTLR